MKNSLVCVILVCIVIFILIVYRQHRTFDTPPLPAMGKKISVKPKSYSLIVARYKENVDWLIDYKMINYLRGVDKYYKCHSPINLYLYLKSDEPLNFNEDKLQEIYDNVYIEKIKNVGMCNQSYLYHIVKNYDRLEDITFFIPGSVTNKIKLPLFEGLMENGYKYKYYFTNIHKEDFLYDFKISNYIVTEEKNQDSENRRLELSSIRPFGKWYEHYIKRDLNTLETNHKDTFSLHADIIRKLPLKFYKDMNTLSSKYVNSEDCHYVERMWYPLFSNL